MTPLVFGSVCSGIEAASAAWHPLGWRAAWLAEIEAFPSAVLAYRYPDVPNLGDMTKIAAMVRGGTVAAPDVLVGGTPCQAFSVAGLRRSLDDARGQLSLSFVDLANAIDTTRSVRGELPAIVVWENVPGVLSTADNAFGCFLAGLAGEDDPMVPPGKKWTNAGCVYGPQRTVAWRVTDAQYFGVAQRRKRLFVVASAREGFDPAEVLFEFDGVRRDSAPRRETRQDTAASAADGARSRSHWDGDQYPHPTLNQSNGKVGVVGYSNQEIFSQRGAYLVNPGAVTGAGTRSSMEVDENGLQVTVGTLCADTHPGAYSGQDAYTGRLVPVMGDALDEPYAFQPRIARNGRGDMGELVNSLTANAGETGKGDAAPCVAYSIQAGALRTNPSSGPDGIGVQESIAYTLEARAEVQAVAFDTTQITSPGNYSSPQPGDPCHPLSATAHPPAVAFSCKDHGGDATVELAPTLRAMGYSGSHANGGGQIAVSFKASHYTRGKDGAPSELAPPLSADADRGDQDTLVLAPHEPCTGLGQPMVTAIRESGQGYWVPDEIAGTLRAEGENRPSRPSCVIFTGDGMVADPISANEAKTYTHEGTTFRLHNCVGQPTVACMHSDQVAADKTGLAVAPDVTAFKSGQSEAAGGVFPTEELSPTLQAQNNGSTAVPSIQYGMAVRRLTPRECERLQAFPDDFTLIPWRELQKLQKVAAKRGVSFESLLREQGKILSEPAGDECPDGPRYKALGNSMCVNNMAWIGRRIAMALCASPPTATAPEPDPLNAGFFSPTRVSTH